MSANGHEVVFPGTGEIVDITDPAIAARALDRVKAMQEALGQLRSILEGVVLEESDRRGTNKVEFTDGTLAEVTRSNDLLWDVDGLRADMEKAGLPPDRLKALIKQTVEDKVVATVANELARVNPEYAAIVERHRRRVPKKPSVKVHVPDRELGSS